ncbi:MAG: LysR family transcriptional regulator [Alphaproteobacteria bacterium]|nr:LysR family transcriptional regulator [Alphaproteobacteria bacterium]
MVGVAMNQRQIEAFRAVMMTGGVTAAAKLLHVTQPAVSRLIRDLQARLGLALFERRGTRLVPTAEALALFREVERSFVGLERLSRAAADIRTRRAGTLRVAAMPALANRFLPRFAGTFLLERPKLDFALFALPSPQVIDWVASGQCDAGFVADPIEVPGVAIETLVRAQAVAVLPAAHRLTRKPRLTLGDFRDLPFVSLGAASLIRYRIDAAFMDAGIKRELRIETPMSETACALVATGVGVSIVDPMTASDYESRGAAVRPLAHRILFDIALVRSTLRPPSGIATEFVDAFGAHLRDFLAERRPVRASR